MKSLESINTRNLYLAIADKCNLGERTVRNAFAMKPVTYQTAAKLARALGVDLREFRIKADNRGRKRKTPPAAAGK